jgi:hypothetical protein
MIQFDTETSTKPFKKPACSESELQYFLFITHLLTLSPDSRPQVQQYFLWYMNEQTTGNVLSKEDDMNRFGEQTCLVIDGPAAGWMGKKNGDGIELLRPISIDGGSWGHVISHDCFSNELEQLSGIVTINQIMLSNQTIQQYPKILATLLIEAGYQIDQSMFFENITSNNLQFATYRNSVMDNYY